MYPRNTERRPRAGRITGKGGPPNGSSRVGLPLKLDGRNLSLANIDCISAAKKFLDRSGDNELFSSSELAEKIGKSRPGNLGSTRLELQRRLPEYTFKLNSRRLLWGSPRAIQELKRQLGVERADSSARKKLK